MLHHRMSVAEGIHQVHSWEVADAAALAALVVLSTDIGKIAKQADTKKFYILENNVGPVWRLVGFTDTASVPEGTSLYFTTARVLATALTGLSTAAGTVVTAAHTILQAIGFLQKQITDKVGVIAGGTTGQVLAKASNADGDLVWTAANAGTVTQSSGTFTPTISGASTAGANTYSAQVGFYRKIGDLVHVQGRVVMTAKDGTMAGNIQINNLPFTSIATTNSFAAALIGWFQNIVYPASKTEMTAFVNPNSTILKLFWVASNGVAISVLPADLTATTDIIFSATYIAA